MLRNLRERFPILCSLAVIIIYLVFFEGFSFVLSFFLQNEYVLQIASMLVADIILIPLAYGFGLSYIFKEKCRSILNSILTGGYFVFAGALSFATSAFLVVASGNTLTFAPFLSIVLFLVTMLGIGFTEELAMRGIVLNLLKGKFGADTDRGIFATLILQGALFGAMHLLNIFAGVSIQSGVVQAILAGFIGILFGAVYLRTHSFFTIALLHGWNDLCAMGVSGFFDTGNTIVSTINSYTWINLSAILIYLIVLAVLLRPSKRAEIKAYYTQESLKKDF